MRIRSVVSADKIGLSRRWSLLLDCGHRVVRQTSKGGRPRGRVEMCHVCPDPVDPFQDPVPGIMPKAGA